MTHNHIIKAIRALCILSAAACAAACSPYAEQAGGSTAEVTVRIVPDDYARTRSSFSWDEDEIRDIQVVVTTEDGALHDVLYSDTPSDLHFTGTVGHLYRLWCASNLGGKVEVRSPEDFTNAVRQVSQASIESSGMPMFSEGRNEIRITGGDDRAVIHLKRMMARVDLTVDKRRLANPGGFSVSGVRIFDPVKTFTPFTDEVSRQHTGDAGKVFDSASRSDLIRLNSGGAVRLYAFENMQGTLLPGNKDPWRKVPSNIGEAGPYCTFIEVVCDYDTWGGKGEGITYRMYLGEDATTNFDVRRNTVYRLTLVPTEEEIRGDRGSWKIEPGEWIGEEPSTEYEYELTVSPDSVTLEEGGTVEFTATYTIREYSLVNGWRVGDGPDNVYESDVTDEADWSIVSGSQWIDNSGAGVFTWADGPGSATVYAIYDGSYDTAGIVTLGHEPSYSSEYEYELRLSPDEATLQEGGTASFTATYISREYSLTDGVRTGADPASVTETDVTSDASWSVVSGNRWVGNSGAGVFSWADGPGSAVISATYAGLTETATVITEGHEPVVEYRYEYYISPEDSEILVGETEVYTVTMYTYTVIDGVEQSGYSCETVSNSRFSWSSSDSSVASVVGGTATGLNSGTAVISASGRNGVTLSATLVVKPVEVIPEPVVTYSFEIIPEGADVAFVGETVSFRALLTVFHDGTVYETRDVTDECIWGCDCSEVSVSDGVVSSSSGGYFDISATYSIGGGEYYDSCAVTFNGREYIGITIEFDSDMSRWWARATASGCVPLPVYISASLYTWTGDYVDDMSFYIGKDDSDSQYGYRSMGVQGAPGDVTVNEAVFSNGSSEFYDEENYIYWNLTY